MPDAPYAMNAYRFIGGAFEDFGDTEANDLIKQLETRNTPYQAGDHLIKPMEEKLARKEAEAEADIVEGHIVEDKTPLIGEQSVVGEITAQDVAEHEQMQNSDFYQFLSNLNTNP